MFKKFLTMMSLKKGETPSVYIEEDRDKTPDWILKFANNFVEGMNNKESDIGILDILGIYDSNEKKVTIYQEAIKICARRMKTSCKILEEIVMAHELAHAATHLGIDGYKKIWETFEDAESEIKEYFAQWYAHEYWIREGLQSHENLMLDLVKYQPEMYGKYCRHIGENVGIINTLLLFERQKKIEKKQNKVFCEFCKIRIATEEVHRFDAWLEKKFWTIPACSVCASSNQQTWLT